MRFHEKKKLLEFPRDENEFRGSTLFILEESLFDILLRLFQGHHHIDI